MWGRWGAGNLGRVGQLGEEGQMGSVYKQPEREVDDSCHNWREPSKWKGTQRGRKGELTRGDKSKGNAPCIVVHCNCAHIHIECLRRLNDTSCAYT